MWTRREDRAARFADGGCGRPRGRSTAPAAPCASPRSTSRSRRDGDGWRSVGTALPVAGEWTLTLHAQTSDDFADATRVSWPVW